MQEGSIGGYVDTTPNKTRRYKKPERVSELIYEEVSDEQDRRNGRQRISSMFMRTSFVC